MNNYEKKEIGHLIRHTGWKGALFAFVLVLASCSAQATTPWQDYVVQRPVAPAVAAQGVPALVEEALPLTPPLVSPLTLPLTPTLSVTSDVMSDMTPDVTPDVTTTAMPDVTTTVAVTTAITSSVEGADLATVNTAFLPSVSAGPKSTPTALPTPTATQPPPTLPPPTPLPPTPVPIQAAKPIPTAAAAAIPPLDLHTTVNYLLLGTDIRSVNDAWRTDSIMVLGVDTKYRRAALLSIPRDLLVDVPDVGQRRINQVDYLGEKMLKTEGGGPALFSQVLSNTLGIKTDHWLRVDMTSFRDFVDIIGGVTVYLDCPYYELSKDDATQEITWFSLPAGDVTMDGETALMFVRLRYLNTDSGRSARQRQFLWALRDQAMSTNLILKIPELWRLFNRSFETDLSLFRLLELGNFGLSLDADSVRAGAITTKDLERYFTAGGADVLRIADPERVQAIIDNIWTAPPLAHTADLNANGVCPPAPTGIPTYLLQEIPLSDQAIPDSFPDWAVEADTPVVVANTGERSIRLRNLPGLAGEVLNAYQAGDRFRILAADEAYPTYPVEQDGYQWVKVAATNGEIGWIAARYLAPIDPQPTPEPTVQP